MNEEQTHLVDILKSAIDAVYHEERFLLRFAKEDIEGLEQAFVFRTGIHLSNKLIGTLYSEFDLDSEYNKNYGNTKKTTRFPDGLRPDLILHKRSSNQDNKLVAEFKGYWKRSIWRDIRKLEDLTDPNEKFQYLIGVFVHIGRTEGTFRYFINGNEI